MYNHTNTHCVQTPEFHLSPSILQLVSELKLGWKKKNEPQKTTFLHIFVPPEEN